MAISARAVRCDCIVLLTCCAHQPMTDTLSSGLRPTPRPKPKQGGGGNNGDADDDDAKSVGAVSHPIKRPHSSTTEETTAAFVDDAHRRLDALCQRTSSSSTATAATSQMALSLRDAAESAEYNATAPVNDHDYQMVAYNPIPATIVLGPPRGVLARLTRRWGSTCTGERCHQVYFGS